MTCTDDRREPDYDKQNEPIGYIKRWSVFI